MLLTMSIRSHRDLKVWQKGVALVDLIYELTETFPKHELYGMASQLRRAAVSVPSNISEGNSRATARDNANFLTNARASLAEIDTLLVVAHRRTYLKEEYLTHTLALVDELGRMTNGLRNKILEAGDPGSRDPSR